MNTLEEIYDLLVHIHGEQPETCYMQQLAQLAHSPELNPMGDLRFGDYVVGYMNATKDPSAVGYLDRVILHEGGVWYQLRGANVAADRRWRHCDKITHTEGEELLHVNAR